MTSPPLHIQSSLTGSSLRSGTKSVLTRALTSQLNQARPFRLTPNAVSNEDANSAITVMHKWTHRSAKNQIDGLRAVIGRLQELGYPASFCLLFDQTWELAASSKSMLSASTAEANRFQFDILAWYIEKEGFSPHRDRQPKNAAATFVDGNAKFATQWIALTPATPENSCL